MNARQRLGLVGAIGGIVIGGLAAVVIPRLDAPPPPPPPKIYPATEPAPHPVIPSEARVEPPKAFCERRDIFIVGRKIQDAQKHSLAVAKTAPPKGAPESCHADERAKELALILNALIGRTGACVARDSELDSEWSQLESAVSALDRCMECTQPRDARVTACKRAWQLVDEAQRTAK
jgi:hypothetical protein